MLKSIQIKNVKGIENATFKLDIVGKRISILVAPNGFGKSSIATAFDSLNRDRLNLRKDDFPGEDESLDDCLSIVLDNETLVADKTKNEISTKCDVFVINSNLYAKTKQQSFGGKTVATSSIEVEPVVLIPTIPPKYEIDYQYRKFQSAYGAGNTLPNASDYIANPKLFEEFSNIDFSKFFGKKIAQDIISAKDVLRQSTGSIEQRKSIVENSVEFNKLTSSAISVPILNAIHKYCPRLRRFDTAFIALQIIDLYAADSALFKNVIKYDTYCNEKHYYDLFFDSIDTTWKHIRPYEDAKKGLVVSFPKVAQISNGQRDFLNFISMFLRIRRKISKPNTIIIIDEVFDYLDDSNLISAQYFISKFFRQIEDITCLYPIILTHLNPYYFRNYRFQKPQIRYLSSVDTKDNRSLQAIIEARQKIKEVDAAFNQSFDQYFLHHHSDYHNQKFESEFRAFGFDANYNTPSKLRALVFDALKKYVDNQECDVVSICIAVRLMVEELVYDQLNDDKLKAGFISTHKTDTKLNFALDNGVDFPEVFSLLGVIYNETLHLTPKEDKITPVAIKLQNKIIYTMIVQVYKTYQRYHKY